jgi:hypothetical protein
VKEGEREGKGREGGREALRNPAVLLSCSGTNIL